MYKANHYVNYKELTALLKHYKTKYPKLFELTSLAKTKEKRDIWLATITNKETGKHLEKPGYWIDGNTHAIEISGSQASLHTIDYLLKNFNKNKEIKELLNTTTFYIVPRISPDGVEHIFNTGEWVRSTNKFYFNEVSNGLLPQDINGDGQVLTMRIKDPNGRWKVSKKDPRILIKRLPDEFDSNETFYRLLPEGIINNWDGNTQRIIDHYGLDFNRQYPANWTPEGVQKGAGAYPLSEIETRSITEAIIARPNISGVQSYHTFSGVILRPFSSKSDDDLPDLDRFMYKAIGKRGEDLTDYPCVSIHHDFRYHPKQNIGGAFLDWAYEHQGLLTFCTEIWSIANKVGIKIDKNKHIETIMNGFSNEDNFKFIKWCDNNLKKGSFFSDWKEFNHPQLGVIEIGGWKIDRVITNPPEQFLKEEVHKNMLFTLSCAKSLPRIEIKQNTVEEIGDGIYKIEVIIANVGYMPTYGTVKAKEIKSTTPPQLRLELGKNLNLIEGKLESNINHLEGRSIHDFFTNQIFGGFEENLNESKHVFIVSGRGKIEIMFNFPRAGRKKVSFNL